MKGLLKKLIEEVKQLRRGQREKREKYRREKKEMTKKIRRQAKEVGKKIKRSKRKREELKKEIIMLKRKVKGSSGNEKKEAEE